MPRSTNPIQQEARDGLAKSARENRGLRGTRAQKTLEWKTSNYAAGCLEAKVGRGRLILWPVERRRRGVSYTSSFGPNSDRSFSGYLTGLTLEEAKKLVYQDAKKHW